MINNQHVVENRRNWKGQVVNYDAIRDYEDHECLYCLTDAQVAVLGGIIEPVGWATRWQSDTQPIDEQWVRQFRDDIQRRLMMACCPDETIQIIFQWTVDGVLQSSNDGGETWTDAPQSDPRNNSTTWPPVPGADGDDKVCAAADGMAQLIKEQVGDNLTDDMSRYTLSELLSDWVQTLINSGGNIFSGLITIAANQIFALVISVIRPALTDGVYDELKCAFFCNMSPDASFTNEQWENVRTYITENISGVAGLFLEHLVFLLGAVGLTNLARAQASVEGDCVDCGCVNNCLSSGWKLYVDTHPYTWGNVVATTEDSITVQAIIVPSVGGYGAAVVRRNLSELCHVTTEFISGGATAWGGNTDLTHIVLDGSGNPIGIGNPPVDCNLLAGISTSPFTIKFTFSPDES